MVLKYENVSSTILIFSCIDRILQIYLEDSTIVFTINSEYYPKIPHIQHHTEYSWIYFSFIKPGVYVIDCSSHDLENILQSLEYNTLFNPNAIFILIADFVDSEMIKILSKYFIYSIMIIENSKIDLKNLYGSDIKMDNSSVPFKIGYCTKQTLTIKNMPERKSITQWSNLNLKIAVGNSPPFSIQDSPGDPFHGLDIDIVEFISSRIQFKPRYEPSENFVGVKKSNMYNGALGMLASKSADMVMGGMFATGDCSLDFTISYPIHRTTYSWFVPGPTSIPFWQRILLIYQPPVSFAILLFYVLMTLLQLTFNRLIRNEGHKFHNEFFKLWSSATTAPIKIPQTEKCSKKMFYVCWFLFWLILNACFASKLLECFIKKKYNYSINSLDALTKSELDICILRGLEFGLNEYGSRVITCTDCEECSNRTAYQRDLITVRNSALVNFYKNRYYSSPNGDPLLHPLKENYFATFNVMIFRKNHPVFEKFNIILKRMITSGIVAYLRRKYNSSWEKNDIRIVSEWRSLRLEYLTFLFQLWTFGLIISITVFAIEVLINRCNVIVE